jgi:hypothetical protein
MEAGISNLLSKLRVIDPQSIDLRTNGASPNDFSVIQNGLDAVYVPYELFRSRIDHMQPVFANLGAPGIIAFTDVSRLANEARMRVNFIDEYRSNPDFPALFLRTLDELQTLRDELIKVTKSLQ